VGERKISCAFLFISAATGWDDKGRDKGHVSLIGLYIFNEVMTHANF